MTVTCEECGSENVVRCVLGLPTVETAEAVERDPNLELGGCVITPATWDSRCRDCGHTVWLHDRRGRTSDEFIGKHLRNTQTN